MARQVLKAEVTGSVWKVLKAPGEHVDEGETLVIFESMKMEIPLVAEEAGEVVEIRVAEGDPVAEGDVVAVLEVS